METLIKSAFAQDVEQGLLAEIKYLPSRYFYDQEGDKIFQKIMRMPEYYLTDCELEIFMQQAEQLTDSFQLQANGFDIIELGAGDGFKTKHLLKKLIEEGNSFQYMPVDISDNALAQLEQNLQGDVPKLVFQGIQGEYFETLKNLETLSDRQKIILFLGSNIGNLSKPESINFLRRIADTMNTEDSLLIGFDLKKDPNVIRLAYDDPHGHSRDFNLNLLKRINREFNADFDINKFIHAPHYDPQSCRALSFLVSTCTQEVHIRSLDFTARFDPWEAIHTEISQKYDFKMIDQLAAHASLKIIQLFTDSKNYFADILFKKQ